MLRKLAIYIHLSATSESIQQITAAPWPQLEELEFGTLDASHLKLLVKKDWPLKVLRCKLCHYMSAKDLRGCNVNFAAEQLDFAAVNPA